MSTTALPQIAPADVHRTLARHILADGYDLVFDFEKSHGSWVHDSQQRPRVPRLHDLLRLEPHRLQPPEDEGPASSCGSCTRVAQLKPSLSDIYSVEYAWFVDTFGRLAMPADLKYAFFVEGGALGVENALKVAFDWKVRRNKAQGDRRREGQQGHPLPRGLPRPQRLHAVAHQHRPDEDRPLPQVPLAADRQPEAALPGHAARSRTTCARPRSARSTRSRKAFADNPDDIAAIIIEPIQAEGGDNHFRPEFLQALQRLARENECFFIVDEVQTGIGHHREDVGLRALRAHARRPRLRQEDAGLRLPGGPEGGRGAAERLQGALAHQLHLGRRPHRHGPLRRATSRSSTRTGWSTTRAWSASTCCAGLRGRAGRAGRADDQRPRARADDRLRPARRPSCGTRRTSACIANGLLLLTCGVRSIRFRPPLNLTAAEADTALDIVRKSLQAL